MKTLKLSLQLLILLPLLLAVSCDTEQPDIQYTHAYAETQCNDPWLKGSTHKALAANVEAYLRTRGITVYGAKASGDNLIMTCQACSCPTGITIQIAVPDADSARVRRIGFVKLPAK